MNPQEHFDQVAKEYDYWKNKNWYYYQNLKALYKSFIPIGKKVWEIGCGTGDILADLEPSFGFGTDISPEMIGLAQTKHPNLRFQSSDLDQITSTENFGYIIIPDVLEHVKDLNNFFAQLARLSKPETKIIISIVNPLWEPPLMLAEKLKMKMPEGPHWRLSISENEQIFKKNGFEIKEKGYRLLIPKKLPGSDWINSRFHKTPLAKLGFNFYWILRLGDKAL